MQMYWERAQGSGPAKGKETGKDKGGDGTGKGKDWGKGGKGFGMLGESHMRGQE